MRSPCHAMLTLPIAVHRRPNRGHLAMATLLIALSVAGCQRKSEQALEEAVCTNLEAVGSALEQVGALKPTSTVGEAAAASKALDSALSALNKSEVKLEKARVDAFKGQLKTFNAEVVRVTRDKKLTLEEAAADLKNKAVPVIEARRRLYAQVKCTPGSTAP